MYGVEMAAAHQLIAFLVLDAASNEGRADVSGHMGGAACGWTFGRWLRRSGTLW